MDANPTSKSPKLRGVGGKRFALYVIRGNQDPEPLEHRSMIVGRLLTNSLLLAIQCKEMKSSAHQ